jgi:hypothetical protein
MRHHLVGPARFHQPRVGDEERTQRTKPHRGVCRFDHRIDAEHDLRGVELQQPAWLRIRRAAPVLGDQFPRRRRKPQISHCPHFHQL